MQAACTCNAFPLKRDNFIHDSQTWHMQFRPRGFIAGIATPKLRKSAYKMEP
jgi:hypothetical protein